MLRHSNLYRPGVPIDDDIVVCLRVLLHVHVADPVVGVLEDRNDGGTECASASINNHPARGHSGH